MRQSAYNNTHHFTEPSPPHQPWHKSKRLDCTWLPCSPSTNQNQPKAEGRNKFACELVVAQKTQPLTLSVQHTERVR